VLLADDCLFFIIAPKYLIFSFKNGPQSDIYQTKMSRKFCQNNVLSVFWIQVFGLRVTWRCYRYLSLPPMVERAAIVELTADRRFDGLRHDRQLAATSTASYPGPPCFEIVEED